MRYFLALITALLMSSASNAQIQVSINFNIDSQPIWGPTGYDYVEYYFLPDIEVYYNVPLHRFIYFENGHWISRSSLPSRYRGYDLFRSYKVVVNERKPYLKHQKYKEQYSSYKDHHDQQPIRDSRDSKYFVNQGHPEHNNWQKQQVRDQGKGNVQGRGNDQNNKRDKNTKQNKSDNKKERK